MTHPIVSKIIKKYTDYYNAYWHLKKEHPEEEHIRTKYLYREALDLLNDLISIYKALKEVDDKITEKEELEALYGYDSYDEDFDDETSARSQSDEHEPVQEDLLLVYRLQKYLDNLNVGMPDKPPMAKPSEIVFNTNFDLDLSHHHLEKVDLRIEGYLVTLYGTPLLETADEISFVKAILKDFTTRAQKHFPDLLKHKIPLDFVYTQSSSLLGDFMYEGRYFIEPDAKTVMINMDNLKRKANRNRATYVHVLAHELAHHYYFHVLDKRHRDYWEEMVHKDYTTAPLIDFIHDMTDTEDFFDFLQRIKLTDPMRYLQLSSIKNVETFDKFKKHNLLDQRYFPSQKFNFNKNPVSTYGSTQPSEAFAEVIGLILGFGTITVLPELFSRMKVIIPSIRLAKEKPLQTRIASLERRLASLEHILSIKTAGSHVKLPSHELAELTHISDKALDHAYHYGMSKPGTFGYKANEQSVLHAIDVIATGNTNIEAIADAVHKGWSHAFFTVKDPAYKDPTIVDEATGLTKGQKKYNSRLALAKTSYHSLSNDEKEKDRVVARAVLAWAEENGWVGGLLP